jgi:hypothetical protein
MVEIRYNGRIDDPSSLYEKVTIASGSGSRFGATLALLLVKKPLYQSFQGRFALRQAYF